MSKGTGWERFDFNKDAPLDDDDEIEGELFFQDYCVYIFNFMIVFSCN